MQQLEPTYLRYVYDGLSNGSISPNNPTSLPIGFIGLFEDEFPSSMPLVERMSILNRLATWALLKGPVSIEMVAEIFNEHPDGTKALVDTYSKWFNSPEPGKYVLYHDRLRTYLLQKLSNHEVQDLNETLISYLENALNSEGLKEAESYALEHLSTHMLVESQMGNNYERLHEFVNQEDLWKRQITTSNEYKWSQRAVQYGIKEGARRHDEMNTLSSTVNSVKLSQTQLTGSAIRSLAILRKGDYETALKNAKVYSGERLMMVYLLMLHELTIGKSKNSKFKSKVCNLILSLVKKNKISIRNYSLYAIYQYEFELFKIGIDDFYLFKNFRLDGDAVHNELKTVLIRLLEYPNLDYDFHETLINKCLLEIDRIDLYILRASKLFKKKDNKTAVKNSDIAINILQKLKFSSFPHSYMNYEVTASDEKYYIIFLGHLIEWYLNISELFAIYNYKKYSLKYLNEAVVKIDKINQELVHKSNFAELKKGLFGEDEIWEFNIYKYHSRLSKLYLLNDDLDSFLKFTEYKSSDEFLGFLSQDFTITIDSISEISHIYKYEIQGIGQALKLKGDEYFSKIYNAIKKEGDNYKFVRCLMLLEKLKFSYVSLNNKKLKTDLKLLTNEIQSFPNNTFRLEIYFRAYKMLFEISQMDAALKLFEESYKEIVGIWSSGENIKKFFLIVQLYKLKAYEVIYNFIDKQRAADVIQSVIESTSSHENYNTKNKVFHFVIEYLVKLRDNSRLNNFLDFLKNNGYIFQSKNISLGGSGDDFKEASLISTSFLQKHVLLLIQENHYDEAVLLVDKYDINIDNDKYDFTTNIYPIDWDTFHLLKIDKKLISTNKVVIHEYNKKANELHHFFKLDDLRSFHDKKTNIIKTDKVLDRYLFSSERKSSFPHMVFNEFFPLEIIEISGITFIEKSNSLFFVDRKTYDLTLEELVYKDLSQDLSIDDSLNIMECFDFGRNLSNDKIQSTNKNEISSHLRKIIFDTYKSKFQKKINKNNKDSRYVFNHLINFIDNTDLGSGYYNKYAKYNFNTEMCFDFALFFFDLEEQNFCHELLKRCYKNKNVLKDFNNIWLNFHEKYSTNKIYLDKIIEIFDEFLSKENKIIIDGGKTTMETIELDILLRLNKLGEKELINMYKDKLLDIAQKTKFRASDDKENFIAELSKLYCKIGDFKSAEIIYNLLSENYLVSLTSRAPDIEQFRIEYILQENFEEFKVYHKNKLNLFDNLLKKDSVNVVKFNKFFIYLKSIVELVKINNYVYSKIILIDFKDFCNMFIDKYQNKIQNDYKYAINLRLQNFIFLFDEFILIEEYNLALESLKDLLRLTKAEDDVVKIIKKSNSDYHIIIETLNNIDSENKKILEVIKQLKKEINEKDKTNYQKYFSNLNDFDNKSYELLSREKNLDYDCLSQLLIHYSKVQIFYNDNPKALNDMSEIIDIHEWLDIKSKINKLKLSN